MASTAQAQSETKPSLWLPKMQACAGSVPSLDGLRALSILIVVLSHTVNDRLFPGGFGVRVFFVISGLLITRLMFVELAASGTVSLPNFYARRILRLYPAIVVYSIVIVVVARVTSGTFDLWEPASALLYFANYLYPALSLHGGEGHLPFQAFWSLSVEEHFYLFFPFLFLVTARKQSLLLICVVSICVACLSLRLLVSHLRPDLLTSLVFYEHTEFQIDAICYGVLIAALCENAPGRRLLAFCFRPYVVAVSIALIIFCLVYRDLWFRETLRYSVLSLAAAILIVAIVFSDRYLLVNKLLNTAPLVWIGKLSYSIYIWHIGVVYIFGTFVDIWPHTLRNVVMVITATLCASVISYYLVERPALRLRRRYRSATATAPLRNVAD